MALVPPSPDAGPQLVEQLVEAAVRVHVALGADPKDIVTSSVAGKMLSGDIVGWQGAFVPRTRMWYDILFHFTRPGVDYLAKLQSKNAPRDDDGLLSATTIFIASVQAMHRKLFETGGAGVSAASTTLFCPPLAAHRPAWAGEAGPATDSHFIQLPHIFMVCDFHASPGMAKIKPSPALEPGDVLNEPIAARGQSLRIPLANRGLIFTRERLAKIVPQLENSQTVWVVEPSLLTRRLHRD